MIIAKDKVVSISYKLREIEDSEHIVEQINPESPLEFIFGNGTMLPEFEKNLVGKTPGSDFKFMLTPEQGYGEKDENAIIDLSLEIFMMNGELRKDLLMVGNAVPMRDSNGNRIDGLVLEIGDKTVKMDFNHPMAGSNLYFEGNVIDVREATEEELHHGHIHHDNHDCGGCSSCGGEHC